MRKEGNSFLFTPTDLAEKLRSVKRSRGRSKERRTDAQN